VLEQAPNTGPAYRQDRSSFAITADDTDLCLIRLQGELDWSNVEELWACAESAIEASTADISLDLSDLTFIDSSGIAQFIRVVRRLGPERRLILDHPSRSIRRVIDVTGLGSIPGIALRPCD